ncbi:hypothetical protein JOC54_002717 [Alkalihalobacillus xiaoxiensis]|uniref:Uncharacterized protein n=1 Tax=Shouchella xiaoxiensis TaxID=766895 RepID=A0ABS2SVB4_9BACI|nr:hypothetical protein [Shouchella xiaoxiensis]MBM7839437.1 hypothetical protein [Shouchella xiaoxiensis]
MKYSRWLFALAAFTIAMLIGFVINYLMYGGDYNVSERWPSHVAISLSFALIITFVSPAIQNCKKNE